MNRVTRGTVVLAAALGAISCKGDPTSDLRNGIDHLEATPSAIFLKVDSTKSVIVQAVDEQGNALGAGFSVGATTGAITVDRDQTWNAVYDNKGNLVLPSNPTSARYIVNTTANASGASFTVSAGGKSIVIPVRIVPDSADNVALSATTPALGDTVVATASRNFKFTPASVVSIAGGAAATVGINADSSQIRFLPGPSATNAKVSVSNVVTSYSVALGTFTATSGTATITTPAVAPITPTISTTTPNINDLVTVTAPAGIKFLPTAKVFFANDQQAVTSVAADSNSLIFRAHQSGASGAVTIANAALSFLTSVPITVQTTVTFNTGATITSLTGTDAFATAPLVAIPDAGKTGGVVDAGPFAVGPAACSGVLGGPCRIYKFVLTGSRTFAVSTTWQGTTDLGLYFANSGGTLFLTAAFVGCDSKGAGAGGQPEACTITLGAGTYYMVYDSFAPFYAPPNNVDPTNFVIAITGQ
jgi:hypothetical protein